MSLLRRRSRPRSPELATDFEQEPQPRFVGRATLVTAVLSTLCLAFFLVYQAQQSFVTYSPAWSENNKINANSHDSDLDDSLFALHPEQHIFRNTTSQEYHWRLTSGFRRPDGVLKKVYLINDAFPGPTLETRSGDRLIIHLENALESGEGVSIHWHGLWQRGSNDMDGAAGITQAPVLPGMTFTYNFTVHPSQHGTYWWHAHDGVQRADGLYGGLVVHQPSPQQRDLEVTREHLLLIGDWYHRSAQDALDFYMHPGAFGLETLPDSILINGAGAFTCSDAVPARPLDCDQVPQNALPTLKLDARQRNILRVVNVGAYTGLSITVTNATIKPLSVDGGHEIEGRRSTSIGFIHPGERFDALVELSGHPGSSESLIVTLDDKPFKYQNPALTITHHFPIMWSGKIEITDYLSHNSKWSFDIQEIKSYKQDFSLPRTADRTIVLYTLTQKLSSLDNEPRGFINHTTWSPHSPPLIDLPPQEWNRNQFVPSITFNEGAPAWVDLVLNNLDEDSHPFHLHGHDFWVLASYSSDLNWGSFNPFKDGEPPGGPYDLLHPVKKDTFYVPRRGYAVLRFRADNPGLWMFHCHVLWHQASGMAMAFDVRD